MSDDYTPPTEEVREGYADSRTGVASRKQMHRDEFDRWVEQVRDMERERTARVIKANSIVIPRADLPKVVDCGIAERGYGRFKISDGGPRLDVAGSETARAIAYRLLAVAEYLDAQKSRPLAVGDRVRVVKPEYVDGGRVGSLAVGDLGEVTVEADDVGVIGFRRDGTSISGFLAAANVARIEDQCCGKCPPIVGGGYDCTCEDNPRCQKEKN